MNWTETQHCLKYRISIWKCVACCFCFCMWWQTWRWMTEACTLATSTISTATCTRPSECSSTSLNHVCTNHQHPHTHGNFKAFVKKKVCLFLHIYLKGRKEQRYWDGQKAVYVVLLGSTVVLPCINRRNVWTDWSNEEEDQQVCGVHELVCRFFFGRSVSGQVYF